MEEGKKKEAAKRKVSFGGREGKVGRGERTIASQ